MYLTGNLANTLLHPGNRLLYAPHTARECHTVRKRLLERRTLHNLLNRRALSRIRWQFLRRLFSIRIRSLRLLSRVNNRLLRLSPADRRTLPA